MTEKERLRANGSRDHSQFRESEGHKQNAYDSDSQHQVFENTQESYNQQRQNYTQEAYGQEDYRDENTGKHSDHGTGDNKTTKQKEDPTYGYKKPPISDAGTEGTAEPYQRYHHDGAGKDSQTDGGTKADQEETTPDTVKTPKYQKLTDKVDRTAEKVKRTQAVRNRLENKLPAKKRLHYDKPGYVKNQHAMRDILKEKEETEGEQDKSQNVKDKVKKVIGKVEEKTGRLSFPSQKVPEGRYRKKEKKKANRKKRKRLIQDTVYYKTFQEADKEVKDLALSTKAVSRTIGHSLRRNKKNLKNYYKDPYHRLKFAEKKSEVLEARLEVQQKKRDRYPANEKRKTAGDEARRAAAAYQKARLREGLERLHPERDKRLQGKRATETEKLRRAAEQKKRYKKELSQKMARTRAKEDGNFLKRKKNHFIRTKKSAAQKAHVVKKVLTTIWSSAGILLIFLFIFALLFLIIMAAADGLTRTYGETVVQSDYGTISDVTAYYKALETNLEEKIQPEKVKEDYPGCYEYIFKIDAIGHNPQTLISYLGAKYGFFNSLEEVREELDKLFEAMYRLTIEIKQEEREIPMTDTNGNPVLDEDGNPVTVKEIKDICYIILQVTPLEEVVLERMDVEEKKQYDNYKLSSGGQQVYGAVMLENWTNLITSNYGQRIHPITGERTFHKGVDIAVPTGTKLYAAVQGTVKTASYSDSAGYYVKIINEAGWIVTFMHMDSLAVTAGQKIEQGDFVGYSGNSGNSTGPHLHLEVLDPKEVPVNPLFIIPSSCAVRSEE